eukprot:gene4019-1445_t
MHSFVVMGDALSRPGRAAARRAPPLRHEAACYVCGGGDDGDGEWHQCAQCPGAFHLSCAEQ